MTIKLVCKALNLKKEIEVKDLFDAINPAKEIVKEALAKGINDPRVRIVDCYYNETWATITKKDIKEKIYAPATLTDYELETLTLIVDSYKNNDVENTDYYNTFGYGDQKRRGAISSLIKKQVIDSNIDPNSFNPIFPIHNFKSTCEKYNLEIPNNVLSYLQ